jgi:hypothetical protein
LDEVQSERGNVLRALTQRQHFDGEAAYDLARARGKNLVIRREKTRRYELQTAGPKAICACLVLREKVIKPLLAGATGKRNGRPPKNVHPLDATYLQMQQHLLKTFAILGLAA